MQYILTAGWDDGIADLAQRLIHELGAGKRVLWLVSGGSNVSASVQIMHTISADLSKNLTIMLIDERYVPVGDNNSNWQQLITAGFDAQQATVLTVLQQNLSFEETIDHYNAIAAEAFAANDIIIAQIGIGNDGHVAGIMVNSDTSTRPKDKFVTGIHAEPFNRLTLTFDALRELTAAYAFAFGEPKKPALTALQSQTIPLDEQPAQILKELSEAYVYNDQLGDTA